MIVKIQMLKGAFSTIVSHTSPVLKNLDQKVIRQTFAPHPFETFVNKIFLKQGSSPFLNLIANPMSL